MASGVIALVMGGIFLSFPSEVCVGSGPTQSCVPTYWGELGGVMVLVGAIFLILGIYFYRNGGDDSTDLSSLIGADDPPTINPAPTPAPRWVCTFCQSSNDGTNQRCFSCGAPRPALTATATPSNLDSSTGGRTFSTVPSEASVDPALVAEANIGSGGVDADDA